MKKFFSFIIRQSTAIILATVFVLAFGIFSTVNMAINLLPDINVPMVCVQVIYAGANAQSVENDVTKELEEGLSSISGITNVESYSYDNLSAVVLSFDYGTDTTDKKSDIQSKLASLTLPADVITSVYDIDLNADALAVLSVTSSKGQTEGERLKNAYISADELAGKLSAIDGVESVEVKGGADVSYVISPIVGLELISPLIVQAFSYGALDIPLGNISEKGGDVQVRNNSDVTTLSDMENMPVALPSSIVTLLSSVKQVMRYYENSSEEDLVQLDTDLGEGVVTVLHELDNMTADETDKLAELKTYMNLASTFTADQLKSFKSSRYYDEIAGAVEGKTDDELHDIADDLTAQYPVMSAYISEDMLRAVRDGKIQPVIGFRVELEATEDYIAANENDEYYTLTNNDYFILETEYVQVYAGIYGYDKDLTEDQTTEILYRIDFAKKTSAAGLSNIADKKQEAEEKGETQPYSPTNAECAQLFTGTELSSDHPIVISSTFMAFVRSPAYEDNMRLLIDKRAEFGDEISAEEFYAIYGAMNLEGVFEFKLSAELISFIQSTDLTELTNGSLVVKTADIAKIQLEESYSSYVYYGDGKASLIKGTVVEIYKSNGANSSAVVREVKRVFAEYQDDSGRDAGAQIALLDDQSQFISDSIINVLVSMLIGGALAVLVIFVFLRKVRTSLIIAITMPLSVLAALICLFLMGITLNMVSLGGLAVGIGMLVDNSIVVIESISKHRDMDKSAYDAAVDGTTEVGGALLGSTLTTICVFIPIIFSGGLTAEIFTDLSWAVIFSLTFSLIVAVTVIPALYSLFCGGTRMLKGGRLSKKPLQPDTTQDMCQTSEDCTEKSVKPTKKPSFKDRINAVKKPRIMNAVANFYGKLLPKFLNHKIVTLITAVIIFGGSVGLVFLTGTEFLPSIDKGQIEINMSYGAGNTLEFIESDVYGFASTLENELDNVEYISVSVGKNGLLALTDTGIITVQLSTNRGTSKVVDKIREIAESSDYRPHGDVTVREIDGVVASLMSGADDLSVTVVGSDGEVLKNIAEDISVKLKESGFKDIKNSSTDSAVEYDLKFDRMKISELGLDYQTLVLTVRIGIASYTACTATIDGEDFDIKVRFDKDAVTSVEELKNFVVGADNGDSSQAVKLKDVAEITRTETEACIRRDNGKQMISVSAALPNTDTGAAGKLMQKIAKEVLTGKAEYAGYEFQSSGISSYLTDAFEGLAVALVISFFLLYAVMAVQFNSAVTPLIVMASIPFCFTGGFFALIITGTSLNVVSFIGLIMLMGVVVNNAIVMLEKIKTLRGEGIEPYTAVQEACKVRLRPIFMTTLTTILALIPLAIGVGQGSELMQPLGIVVIGGLLLGTLVTLIVVPTVYCAVYRIKNPNDKKEIAQ